MDKNTEFHGRFFLCTCLCSRLMYAMLIKYWGKADWEMRTSLFSCMMILLWTWIILGLVSSSISPMVQMSMKEYPRSVMHLTFFYMSFFSSSRVISKAIYWLYFVLPFLIFLWCRITQERMLMYVTSLLFYLQINLVLQEVVARFWIVVQTIIFSYITVTMAVLGCLVSISTTCKIKLIIWFSNVWWRKL